MDKQASQPEPTIDETQDRSLEEATIEEVTKYNEDKLLQWIEQKRPGLLRDTNLEIFKQAFIDGDVFVDHAGDVEFFEIKCKLPIGISERLAKLAREIAGGETAGIKSKLYLSCHAHHVDSKLTTSQETDSRPKMWTCPTPPI